MEDKFYKAFLTSPGMVIITSLKDGKYTDVNDSFIQATGYSREELVGHTIEELNLFANSKDQQRMEQLLKDHGFFKNAEHAIRTKSGEFRQWLCSAEILNIDKDPCMVAVATDVTELKRVQQALRESENKLNVAFRSSPHAIIVATMGEGKFIEVNESAVRLTGYTREEIIGHTLREVKIWEDQAFKARVSKTLWEKGRVTNEEVEYHSNNGNVYNLLLSAEIVDIGGQKCLVAFITDVTAQKKIEQTLRESEDKFSKAFSASPNGFGFINVEDAKFIEVNDSFVHFVGYSRDEIIGHNAEELNLWVDPEENKMMAKSMLETGSLHNMRIKSRMKSGETRIGLFSAETLNISNKRCMILVITDITDQLKTEEALRKSEEKFTKAFRSSPGILSISRVSDGTFLEINESFTRVLGYTRKDTIGHASLELGIWVNPAEREKMIRQLEKNGRVSNQEYQHRTKSGEIVTFLFSAEQIEFDGEPCVLSFANDVTEYKRIEMEALEVTKLRELDRLRTELLANVSHELRTPLASIKGFATMLIDYGKRLTAQEKQEYLETIDKNTDRLVELIEQLLEMSRLGSGMLSIKKASTNISNLCHTVINEVRVREPSHNYILDMPGNLPLIDVDERRIRQVLDNVINNAVKYSEAGTDITLTVRKNTHEMLFCVADHGIGIPEKDLPRLFERLFLPGQGQKTELHGAGLGLSICKGLVEAHGGRIWVESKQGTGTSCYFTLPIKATPRSNTNKTGK